MFLKRLDTFPALHTSHLFHLDGLYRLSQTTNSKIRRQFYLVALKDPTSIAARVFLPPVLDWVVGKDTGVVQGTMATCRPLFRAANRVDRGETVVTYMNARALFHPIARKLIEQVR